MADDKDQITAELYKQSHKNLRKSMVADRKSLKSIDSSILNASSNLMANHNDKRNMARGYGSAMTMGSVNAE